MSSVESPYPIGDSRSVLTVVPDQIADDALDVDELGSRIVGLAGRLAAATCRWLLLVARFDAREGANRFGLPSTARWLGHYCGLSGRTARAHVAVARALAAYPPLAAAMAAGRLSFSHVRAIARVADLGGARLVENLIAVAEHGSVGQLEEVVRGLRTVEDNEHPAPPEQRETLSHRWREDSSFGLSAKLDPEHGALVQTAIERLARAEGLTHAQALTRMAEIALAVIFEPGRPAPRLRGDEHAAVIVHVDAALVPDDEIAGEVEVGGPAGPRAHVPAGPRPLPAQPTGTDLPATPPDNSGPAGPPARHGRAGPRPYARIAAGPGLPDRVIKRLACGARVRTVVFDPHQPDRALDIGASRRLVSAKQYRALLLRDGGCAHPGCRGTIGLEAHHVRHWLHGGATVMSNLVLLCRAHHHALHDNGFRIVALGAGRFRFLRPDGRELAHHVDPSRLAGTSAPIEDEHLDLAADAATTRWDGTRLDHHYAIAVLAQHLRPSA